MGEEVVMSSNQKFFKILAEGIFTPDEIDTEVTAPGATLVRSNLAEAFIEGGWEIHLAKGNKPWPDDTNPRRYRTAKVGMQDGRLKLILDPCVSYKDFISSLSTVFEERYGHDAVPDPLAVTVLVRTVDNRTLMTLRDQKTDYKPGGWHASTGGFMEIRRNETPVQAGMRELEEETGIKPDELDELVAVGVVYNPWTLHTDLILSAKTKLTSAEVLVRKHDDENELLFVDTTAESYEYWIVGGMHANVVITMAAMIMVGENLFGLEWRNKMLDILADGSRDYGSLEVRQTLEKRDLAALAQMVADHRKTNAI